MQLKEAINLFNGVMDLDHADKDVVEGNYREMYNGENAYTNQDENGNVINVQSNLLIGNPFLTVGIPHKTIGSYEDKTGESIIYLVAEQFGGHGIYRWYRQYDGYVNGRIEKIYKLSNPALYTTTDPNPFNFSLNSEFFVTGLALVNNLFSWTDYLNRPRCFDIVRANETNKRRKFNLCFNKSNFDVTTDYTIDVYAAGTLVPIFTLTWTSAKDTYAGRNEDFINAYKSALTAINYFTISDKVEYSILEMVQVGQFVLNISENQTDQSLLVPDNFYPDYDGGIPASATFDLFSESYIDFIKYLPLCQPTVVAGRDEAASGVSLISNKVFQFRLRYKYKGFEKSRLGAISNIALYNIDGSGNQTPTLDNYIDINFTDPRLENKGLVSMIDKIDLCVREGNTGQWRVFQTLNQFEFAGTGLQQVYRFFNNEGTVEIIPEIDSNEQYDAVPLLAKSLENAEDRIFMAGNVEGYDTIPIKANIDIDYTDNNVDSDTFSVAGIIVIRSLILDSGAGGQYANQPMYDNNNYPLNAGWGGFPNSGSTAVQDTVTQTFPDPDNLRGFVVYFAGTEYYAVSLQNNRLSDGTIPSGLQFDVGNNMVFAADPSQIASVITNGMYVSDFVRTDPFELNSIAGIPVNANGIALTSTANGAVPIGDNVVRGTGMFFSRFEITGVKAGKYVMRLAAPAEVTAAMLQDGTKDYQQTSATMFAVAGQAGFEFVVTVSDADSVINPLTGRKTVFVGVTELGDLTTPGDPNRQITGYLSDEYNSVAPTDYEDALTKSRINYGKVFPNLGAPALATGQYTALAGLADHNGYFYLATSTASPFGVEPASAVQVGTYDITDAGLIMWDKAGGAFTTTTTNVLISITTPTDVEISTNRRTHITGVVSDSNGNPLSGVNVVLYKGSWQHTFGNGDYSILTYAEYDEDTKDITVLYQSAFTNVSLLNAGLSYFINAFGTIDLGSADYNDVDGLLLDPVEFEVTTAAQSLSRWKPGGDFEFGIVYYDEGDRRCAVITNEDLAKHITFTTEKDENGIVQPAGARILSWQIFHEPPTWAVKYHWVRTLNLQHGLYKWWAVNKVQYVNDIDDVVGYNSPSATFAKLNFDNVPYYTINKFPGAVINFGFQVGDRIRVLTGTVYIESEIVKIIEPYFYVRKSNTYEYKDSTMVELYHPREQTDINVFYEFGECYEVLWGTFAGVCKKYHAGQTQDQSFGPLPFSPVTPATGTFTTGNSWQRQRRLPVGVTAATASDPAIEGGQIISTIFDGSVSDFYLSDSEDIGRPNTTELLGRLKKPTDVVFGDQYLYGSKTNGLCTFRALNKKTYNYEYGLLNKLLLVKQDVMYMVFHNSYTLSVYLGKAVLRDLEGAQLVAVSNDVMSKPEKMQRTFGTQDPATVHLNDEGDVMGYDEAQGVAWRASGNGMVNIAEYLLKGWWNDTSKQRRERTLTSRSIGTYDLMRDKYIVSLPLIAATENIYPKTKVCMPDFVQNTVIVGYISTSPTLPLFTIPLIFAVWAGDTNAAIAQFLTAAGYTVTTLDCGCIEVQAPSMAQAGASLNIRTSGSDLVSSVDSACNTQGNWVNQGAWINNGSEWEYGNVVGGNISNLSLAIPELQPNTDYVLQYTVTQAPTNTSFLLNVSVGGISLAVYSPVVSVVESIPFNSGSLASNLITFQGQQPNATTEVIKIDAVHLLAVVPVVNNYNFKFDNGTVADGQIAPPYTLAFQKLSAQVDRQGWKTFYRFHPEFYGRLRNDVVMFKDGELWLHGAGVGFNNFFGIQYTRSIKYVMNADVSVTKDIKAVSTFSRYAQNMPVISIPANAEYPLGMQSRLVKANFRVYNGEFYSETLRDETDPTFAVPLDALFNGRPLQGEYATMTVEDDSVEQSPLKYCKTVYFYISKFPNL